MSGDLVAEHQPQETEHVDTLVEAQAEEEPEDEEGGEDENVSN